MRRGVLLNFCDFIYEFLEFMCELFTDYIKLSIPWSNVFGTNTEVRLELDGLYILAGPITDRPYDSQKDEELVQAIKQAKLQAFEKSTIEKVCTYH